MSDVLERLYIAYAEKRPPEELARLAVIAAVPEAKRMFPNATGRDFASAVDCIAGTIAAEASEIMRSMDGDSASPITRSAMSVLAAGDKSLKQYKAFRTNVAGFRIEASSNRLLVSFVPRMGDNGKMEEERPARSPHLRTPGGRMVFEMLTGQRILDPSAIPNDMWDQVEQIPKLDKHGRPAQKQDANGNWVPDVVHVTKPGVVGKGMLGHDAIVYLHLESMSSGQGSVRIITGAKDLGLPRGS